MRVERKMLQAPHRAMPQAPKGGEKPGFPAFSGLGALQLLHSPKKILFPVIALLISTHSLFAQFAPVAGLPGTTAFPGDSSAFVEWATGCTIQRGPVNIADTSLGYASAGTSNNALGPAGTNGTVSLGDGGTATVTFDHPIYNGAGFDFAVFENGFMSNDSNLAFLELGFVEVSSDGVNFFRFPSVSNVEDTIQTGGFASTDGGQLYDLAGKYIYDYGTPFDLEELKDTPGLDVNNIIAVRVIDVVGSIDSQYAMHDSRGHIVNDPWPTPYASCGFDLDAVGVINANMLSGIKEISVNSFKTYPNPVKSDGLVFFSSDADIDLISLSNVQGKILGQWIVHSSQGSFTTSGLSPGIYILSTENSSSRSNAKLVVE